MNEGGLTPCMYIICKYNKWFVPPHWNYFLSWNWKNII